MTKERDDKPTTEDMTVKLVIDTKVAKVLFAEASKDFVDFLFFLLSMPIATVARLFNSYMVGSMGNLHFSFANLDETYLQPNLRKNALLNPMIVQVPQPQPITESPSSLRFYTCQDPNCKGGVTNVSGGAFCPGCFGEMNQEIKLVVASSGVPNTENESKGNVKEEEEVVSYIIYDDLTITPMSTTSIASMMNNLDVSNLEERNLAINRKTARELLLTSFESTTVLTDVFLGCKPEVVDMRKLSSQFAEEMNQERTKLQSLESLKETDITRWLPNNEVLHNVREELMKGFRALPNATDVGIKKMGKIDPIPFWVAHAKKGLEGVDPSLTASSWERLGSNWDPFIMIPKEGKNEEMQKVINEDDRRLKELRSEQGDDVYKAVVKGLTELNEYNPGGSYGCDEVWNFKERRKASLNEGIQCLFHHLNTLQSSKRSRSVKNEILHYIMR